MAYTLDDFCADSRAALKADPGFDGQEKVRQNLEKLLQNEDFVAATFPPGEDSPMRTLYQDPETGFMVLAHVNTKAKEGFPHDHGASWAVYGQAIGHTKMFLWRRSAEAGSDAADIEMEKEFTLDEGEVGIFTGGAIHSTAHDGRCALVRVTGTDLDTIPRLRFDLESNKAIAMMPQAEALRA